MSSQRIDILTYWQTASSHTILDVRTPAEYAKGHIPGAINLPLLSNEERVVVGTTYKQISPQAALEQGLEYVGPKMKNIVQQARNEAKGNPILVHCWRGGKRSESVAWLLRLSGLSVKVLEGGYRAYRVGVRDGLDNFPLKPLILGGATGSAKTEILKELEKLGEQVIDLEGLCRHRGSAFGNLTGEVQPSIEQFENELWALIQTFDPERRVWLENEGRLIGTVHLREKVWQWMQGPIINIVVPFEKRLEYLIQDYGKFPIEALRIGFGNIKKRIGGQNYQIALDALERGDLETAAGLALNYYDKSYDYLLKKKQSLAFYELPLKGIDAKINANQLLEFWNQKVGQQSEYEY